MSTRPAWPWRRWAVAVLVAANALAAALIVIAATQAGREDAVDGQIGSANVAVGALVVAGIGDGTWLVTGRAAVRRRTAALLARVDR